MEFGVGIMLILLGALTLTGMGGVIREAASFVGGFPRPADHVHAHGDYVHRHAQSGGGEEHGHREETPRWPGSMPGSAGPELYQWLRPARGRHRPRLAGSAVVALLVLTLVPRPGLGDRHCCVRRWDDRGMMVIP